MQAVRRIARAALLPVVAAMVAGGCDTADETGTNLGNADTTWVKAVGATRLEVDSSFEVRVTLGQPEAATVTYDGNLTDLLDVGVDGRTLRIRFKPHRTIRTSPHLKARVTLSRLEGIRVAGDSTVTVSGKVQGPALRLEVSRGSRVTADLELERVDVTVSGASRLELTGSVGSLHADGSGASNFELAGLRLHDLDIQLSGTSRATVQADRTIAAQLSGASYLTYTGTPRFTRRDASGASTIRSA